MLGYINKSDIFLFASFIVLTFLSSVRHMEAKNLLTFIKIMILILISQNLWGKILFQEPSWYCQRC